jgi:hypothetical protein
MLFAVYAVYQPLQLQQPGLALLVLVMLLVLVLVFRRRRS